MNKHRKTIILSILILTVLWTVLNRKGSKPTISATRHPTSPSAKPIPISPPITIPQAGNATPTKAPSSVSLPYHKIRHELSRFHHPGTHIVIEKKEELSPARHRVLIKYTLPNGRRTSYKSYFGSKKTKFAPTLGTNHSRKPSPIP